MSPDESFAAHMWPWPDPLLKRDPAGRVIFVNAAFLKIYGGTVQDWTGNVVGGWPAPQNNGQPFRFETRMPSTDSSRSGEKVYDWIEYTLADNNALCIARDVTALLTPNDPPPGDRKVPTEDMPAQNYVPPMDMEPAQNVAAAYGEAADHAPLEATPNMAGNMAQNLAEQAPVETLEDTSADTSADASSDYVAPTYVAPDYEAPQYTPPTDTPTTDEAQAQSDDAPSQDHLVQNHIFEDEAEPAHIQSAAAPAERTRDYERRALPIEDGDSVLGSNWRDAVIAKAVGADLPTDGETEDVPTEPSLRKAPTDAPSATPVTIATPAPDGTKQPSDLRILLAEDNAINALLTRTLLEAEGCTVDVVEDGALAVEAVKNARYDLIFMDMRMPNMDGLESTRKIRSLPNVPSDMPIVALTANAFDDDRNACFDSGMNDFMTKPVSAEELSDMVHNWAINPPEQRKAS